MNQTFELFLSGTDIPHRYKVSTPGVDGGEVVDDSFELRSDSVELTMTLGALAKAATRGERPERDLHVEFGQRLHGYLFGGAVGQCWQERRKSAGRKPLALVVRIDPDSARFLQRIPWEYLHDEKDFLSTNWRTPVYRLPANVASSDFELLKEALRLLVVIAAPLGLNENEVLNFAREEDFILAATSQARKTGKVRVEFAPNGSLETLEQYLREYNPHLLHFVGHGVFDDSADSGMLLMETRDGYRREVWNKDFAEALVKTGRDLRGVFLSACQSAVASRAEGFGDLASYLLEEGIPAVTAMQYSVLNTSAMAFGSAFYKRIADGKLIEDAFTEARQALRTSSPNNVDFATPVLFLSESDCLHVDMQAGQSVDTPLDFTGLTKAQNFVGRAAEIRELQTRLDPQSGTWRAAVIHALGGMGKTVLAARLAERMAGRLDGVISIRMTPTITGQNVLDHIGDILFSNNARFNLSEIYQYQENRSKPLELSARVSALAQILRKLRLLVIFDNCEDILTQGREVSRATGVEQLASQDPELLPLIAMLVGSVDGPSRFLFTSRVDFSPVEENRLADAIGHLPLKEMSFREAVYLMETLPPLDSLPVVILSQLQMNAAPSPQPLAMRDVYERLGGHPYRLSLFAKHAQRLSISQVLDDLSDVQQESLEFTLLEKAVAQLPGRAALLLHRGVVFDEPVAIEGLAFMLGDEQDVMPDVTAELKALLDWGLAVLDLGTKNYSLHTVVRLWTKSKWTETEKKDYLHRAADYWRGVAVDNRNLLDFLHVYHYLYRAGDYQGADEVVQKVWQVLILWGHVGVALYLLRQSVDTLQGDRKAAATTNLATVLRSLGDYGAASKYYEQVLPLFNGLENRHLKAQTLFEIGTLHYLQGDYEQAREFYQQSLIILREIGDRAGVAKNLHQIGMLHHEHGDYKQALDLYQQSQEILEELGDRVGVTKSLHQLGMLYHDQGDFNQALELYQQAVKIAKETGDRAGVAHSQHQIGNLCYLQGKYKQALDLYQQSREILEEIGDRTSLANSLHQIGMLHEQQGNYPQAMGFYQKGLRITEEIGDRSTMARSLHQIAHLFNLQGEYKQALDLSQQAGKIFEEIGDRASMARSLHQQSMLKYTQGDLPESLRLSQQSLKIQEEIGDRVGMANSLAKLGLFFEQMDQLKYAIIELVNAFFLFVRMGMPEARETQDHLKRLQTKAGKEAFSAAIDVMGLPTEVRSTLLEALSSVQAQNEVDHSDYRKTLIQSTIAVLTSLPNKKDKWWQSLRQLQKQIKDLGEEDLLRYVNILLRLVEGAEPATLTADIPEEFKSDWQSVLDGISKKE